METAQMSPDRRTDKENIGILHTGISLSHQEGNFAICDIMDEPTGNNAKWNKSDREG